MKFNKDGIQDLSKGKVTSKVGYNKKAVPIDPDILCDIINNGGQGYVISQSVLDTGVQCAEIRIYFKP